MTEEKRKFPRFKCLFPGEFISSDNKNNIIQRVTVHNFSFEGLKLRITLNIDLGSTLSLKIYVPEIELTTSLSSEIIWSKLADNKLELGLKIKDWHKKSKDEILDWVTPKWIEKEGRN